MQRLLIAIFFLCAFPAGLEAGQIILDGHYFGSNLYVMNPTCEKSFCVIKVEVNGQVTGDEIRSNAFEIDFSRLALAVGDSIHIVITYHDDCMPKVINPHVIKPDQDFRFTEARVNRNDRLSWKITGIIGPASFFIEHFRWNNWVKVGEVPASDSVEKGCYEADVLFHSGRNEFRIMRKDALGNEVYSKEINYYDPRIKPVALESGRIIQQIAFSDTTIYELYNLNGDLIKSGYASTIDVSELEKGKYFLNFDAQTMIIKKR